MGELQIEAAKEEHKYYPYTGIFFANRHSFWQAGQDSWTLPPAQNQDMFIQLTNVEPVLQGILQRRRGYTFFAPTFANGNVYTRSYSFRSENLGARSIIWSSGTGVDVTDEAGNVVVSNLIVPSTGFTFVPRMVLSRDYGYFGDGVQPDYKKWDGTTRSGNLTNWGIDVTNSTGGGGNSGIKSPSVAVNDSSGVTAWSNPNNVFVQDGNDAVLTQTQNQIGDNLLVTGFGFSVPSNATITQIIVSGAGFMTSAGGFFGQASFTLLKNGVLTGNTNVLTASLGIPKNANGPFTMTFSPTQPSPSWGYNWTPADVNNANFGVAINGVPFRVVDTQTTNIDLVQITVVYSLPSGGGGGSITVAPGAPSSGNINLLNGRTYFYAFQNSKTGHVSNIGQPSLSTGPLTNQNVVLTTIPTCLDPQVDTTLILATADGNDETTLYLLTSLTNGTSTYTDNTPDAAVGTLPGPFLLTNLLYLDTDQFGVIHGVANNNPPPVINFMTKHKGRIYGSLGRALYFSKNLDETTTANGLITSKWEEAWPATNQFDISETAETIQAILSDGETLWIATERCIRRLIGDSPSNFQKPEIQFNETGVLNQEVWKVVFYEGQPVGTMWLTPDFRVIGSDFNTYLDVGTPIQDVLNSINKANARSIHASYVNLGPADYYMLYIPTGTNTFPDTVCVYNLRSQKWFIWKPTDLITTSLFLIDGTGLPRWLFATYVPVVLHPPSGPVINEGPFYEWSFGTFQDRANTSIPISYPATMQTSWLDFGDYTLRKFVNQVIPTTADQFAMTIQVDAASNELDFNNPLNVVPATTVIPAAIPTDVFVPLASGPSHSRAFRFTFVSPPSAIGNVLTGFSVEAGGFHKY